MVQIYERESRDFASPQPHEAQCFVWIRNVPRRLIHWSTWWHCSKQWPLDNSVPRAAKLINLLFPRQQLTDFTRSCYRDDVLLYFLFRQRSSSDDDSQGPPFRSYLNIRNRSTALLDSPTLLFYAVCLSLVKVLNVFDDSFTRAYSTHWTLSRACNIDFRCQKLTKNDPTSQVCWHISVFRTSGRPGDCELRLAWAK